MWDRWQHGINQIGSKSGIKYIIIELMHKLWIIFTIALLTLALIVW